MIYFKRNARLNAGFSLVELSIVLVILGLLVGGVMTGQNLIKAAELRSVATEYKQWTTAVNLFKDKYFAIPGDMPNAVQFWGRADDGSFSGDCAAPLTDLGGGTETCNGNGDGILYEDYEWHRFWEHLANAGLMNGDYTGTQGSAGNTHSVFGENAPRSKFSNGGWSAGYKGVDAGNANFWLAYDYGNAFFIGSQHFISGAIEQLFSPEEAWNIDTKMDDGKPAQGRLIIHWHQACTTAADENDSDAEFKLQESGARCSLVFTHAY